MHCRLGQSNLVEGLITFGIGANVTLDPMAALLHWSALEAVLAENDASPIGRPSYPAGPLLRALLLQAWHTLTASAAKAAFADRLSFRRFLGVGLNEQIPDHATLWRVRKQLDRRGLDTALFAELERQLDAAGLILRAGTLADASLMAADVSPAKHQGDGRPVAPNAR